MCLQHDQHVPDSRMPSRANSSIAAVVVGGVQYGSTRCSSLMARHGHPASTCICSKGWWCRVSVQGRSTSADAGARENLIRLGVSAAPTANLKWPRFSIFSFVNGRGDYIVRGVMAATLSHTRCVPHIQWVHYMCHEHSNIFLSPSACIYITNL